MTLGVELATLGRAGSLHPWSANSSSGTCVHALVSQSGDEQVSVNGVTHQVCDVLNAVRAYARGFSEQGYPAGSLVFVTVRNPIDVLQLSLGAWWAGLWLVFASPDDHRERDRCALELDAAIQICDAGEIVDEEHLRHRDVPAVAPADLAMARATWLPRCTAEETALGLLMGNHQLVPFSHAMVVEMATDRERRPGSSRDDRSTILLEALGDLFVGIAR